MFEVVLSPEALSFFAAAHRTLARKLARCFGQLEREPRRHNNIRRLTGEFAGLRRFRIGDWRVRRTSKARFGAVHHSSPRSV